MRTKLSPRDAVARVAAKCGLYSSIPVADWNHYHLLGYWLDRTNTSLPIVEEVPGYERARTEPSRHPYLKNLETIFRAFDKDPEATKAYLDWLLSKHFTKPDRGMIEQYQKAQGPKISISEIMPGRVDRTSALPEEMQALYQVPTWGDLFWKVQAESIQLPADIAETLARVV